MVDRHPELKMVAQQSADFSLQTFLGREPLWLDRVINSYERNRRATEWLQSLQLDASPKTLEQVADDFVVMQDGRIVWRRLPACGEQEQAKDDIAGWKPTPHDYDEIVGMMAGRDVRTSARSSSIVNREVLYVEDITLKHPSPG